MNIFQKLNIKIRKEWKSMSEAVNRWWAQNENRALSTLLCLNCSRINTLKREIRDLLSERWQYENGVRFNFTILESEKGKIHKISLGSIVRFGIDCRKCKIFKKEPATMIDNKKLKERLSIWLLCHQKNSIQKKMSLMQYHRSYMYNTLC